MLKWNKYVGVDVYIRYTEKEDTTSINTGIQGM